MGTTTAREMAMPSVDKRFAAIAAIASVVLTGCLSAHESAELERLRAVKDELDEIGSPLIRSTDVTAIWGDPITLVVRLSPGSSGKVKARTVWCELLLPRGVRRGDASVYNFNRDWDPPQDCDDPDDFGRAWKFAPD